MALNLKYTITGKILNNLSSRSQCLSVRKQYIIRKFPPQLTNLFEVTVAEKTGGL